MAGGVALKVRHRIAPLSIRTGSRSTGSLEEVGFTHRRLERWLLSFCLNKHCSNNRIGEKEEERGRGRDALSPGSDSSRVEGRFPLPFPVEKRGSGMFNASFNISMSNIALTRGI